MAPGSIAHGVGDMFRVAHDSIAHGVGDMYGVSKTMLTDRD